MAEQNTPNLHNINVPTPDGGGGAQSLYDIMAPDYLNKPVAQLNVRDFIGLLQPLERKLDTLEYFRI